MKIETIKEDIDELWKRVDNNNTIIIQMCSESKSRPIETVLSHNDRNALSSGYPEVFSS